MMRPLGRRDDRLQGPRRSSHSRSKGRCSSSKPKHRDWSRCSRRQNRRGYDVVSFCERLVPLIYLILLFKGIFLTRERNSRERWLCVGDGGGIAAGGRYQRPRRFSISEWRGTPAIPVLPSHRQRFVGDRVSRIIGSKGRAGGRVRERRGVVRGHNRNTEMGAVGRGARTGGDV